MQTDEVTPSGKILLTGSGPDVEWLDSDLWMLSPTIYEAAGEGFTIVVELRRVAESVGPVQATIYADDGERLDSSVLRALQFRDMTEQAAFNAIQYAPDGEATALRPAAEILEQLRSFAVPSPSGRYAKPTGEALEAVGVIYRVCVLAGANPQSTLIDTLGISRSTANYWVADARRSLDKDWPTRGK